MSTEKVHFERRKHQRVKVCSGVFAVNSHFGLIDDINVAGLTFRYVERKPWNNEPHYSGSLFGEDEMLIDNIPIKHVSKRLPEKNETSRSNVIKKRRIIFGDLSAEQVKLINKFISINARDTDK